MSRSDKHQEKGDNSAQDGVSAPTRHHAGTGKGGYLGSDGSGKEEYPSRCWGLGCDIDRKKMAPHELKHIEKNVEMLEWNERHIALSLKWNRYSLVLGEEDGVGEKVELEGRDGGWG